MKTISKYVEWIIAVVIMGMLFAVTIARLITELKNIL